MCLQLYLYDGKFHANLLEGNYIDDEGELITKIEIYKKLDLNKNSKISIDFLRPSNAIFCQVRYWLILKEKFKKSKKLAS